jgi:glycosyltransferase involved in cell wall biosynthesis
MTGITILHFPAQPHFFSFGGFDMQMNRVISLTNNRGVLSKPADLWSRSEQFDVAHFWGFSRSHELNIRFCKQNNKRVIVSGLFPNITGFRNSVKAKIIIWLNTLLKNYEYLQYIDSFTVINNSQANYLLRYLHIPSQKIRIIPTILDDDIFLESHMTNNSDPSQKGIICVGTICERKNQIRLAKAAIELDMPVCFVGRYESREKSYEIEFKKILNENTDLITRMQDISTKELVEMYYSYSIVACISEHETEPASVLEGMYFRKPILISNQPFSNNSKFSGAIKCKYDDIIDIKNGLLQASQLGSTVRYENYDPEENVASNVVSQYIALYGE